MKTFLIIGAAVLFAILGSVSIHDHLKLTDVRDKQAWHEKAIRDLEDAVAGHEDAIERVKTAAFIHLKTAHHNDKE